MQIKYSKTVGVLGGMGPYAALAFCTHILNMSGAKKDWEHIRTVIDNNSHIPSRTRHLLYNENSPVHGMIESAQKLAAYPVDFIVIPCNSACYFLDQVQPHVSVPLLNITKICSHSLSSTFPKPQKCLVLGGYVTYTMKTYENIN